MRVTITYSTTIEFTILLGFLNANCNLKLYHVMTLCNTKTVDIQWGPTSDPRLSLPEDPLTT